jgi:hypothetical protein
MSHRRDKRVLVSLLCALFMLVLDDTLSKVIPQFLLKPLPNAQHATPVTQPLLIILPYTRLKIVTLA